MDVRLSEDLWATSMLPEGVLVRWRRGEGAFVASGAPLAEVRIEGGLHEIISPCWGRLDALARENAVVEPGMVIARVTPDRPVAT
ncbi:lipoyl domain-containing protein [Caulobacter sp. S45]|uniref:lipoyl domain-containing protein n=1 Tax=Caulobacter sp. S45 TaxID=1641861 RepID=UPI00131AA7E4|nr:lipoyl domain-containing protein [Caulobacter sp. S45]